MTTQDSENHNDTSIRRSTDKARKILQKLGTSIGEQPLRVVYHPREKSYDMGLKSNRSIHLYSDRSLMNKTTIGMKGPSENRVLMTTSIDHEQSSVLGINSMINFTFQQPSGVGKTIILSKNSHVL